MFCLNETKTSKLKMESEVSFERTNRRGVTGKKTNMEEESNKQTNGGEERAVGGRIQSDGFGESLFISCIKIEPKLRNFQVGLRYTKLKL